MGAVTKDMILEDLSGTVIGRLTLIKKLPKITGRAIKYRCVCECGNTKDICSTSLKNGDTKSCGCLRTEMTIERETIHGHKSKGGCSDEYITWVSMKERCYNKNNKRYNCYGGRGIKVCQRWLHSFPNFFMDMGKRTSKKHSIDRINVNGNYTPSNCRWATKKEQQRNQRTNRWFEYKGIKLILSDWAKKLKVDKASIYYQLSKNRGFDYIAEYFINKHKIKI